MKWTIGIAILFLFPYVMKYAFNLNEIMITLMRSAYGGGYELELYIGEVSDLLKKDVEFRDPTYVSRGALHITMGSEDATNAYINRMEDYKAKGDIMRIMRAMAGITGRFLYVILWYIMLWQLIMFLYVYLKRYLIIAFLIAIFPVTLVEYIVGSIATGKQSSISLWAKEFFVNVFLQTIHAVIYTIVSGVVIGQLQAGFESEGLASINWFILIVAINFVFAGEKVLVAIVNAAATESIASPGDVANKAKDGAKNTKKGFKKIVSFIK